MKHLKACVALSIVAALAGCTSRILSGQLDFDNGIAYKHGSNDPYSGTVHFNEMPSFVSMQLVELPGATSTPFFLPTSSCDVEFNNGVAEGRVSCHYSDGDTLATFSIHNRHTDGEELIYRKGGNKAFEYHWADGRLDGDQRVWSKNSKYILHEWHEKHGQQIGVEILRNPDGSQLSEGEWEDDGKYSGTAYVPTESAVYTLKDGVKEGKYFKMDDSDFNKHTVDGSFEDDQQEGTWTYRGSMGVDQLLKRSFSHDFGMRIYELLGLPQASSAEITWSKGRASGPVKVYDTTKHVLLTFNLDGEEILPPVVRFDPATGKRFVFSDVATLQALNAVSREPPLNQVLPTIDARCERTQSPPLCEQNLMREAWKQKQDVYEARIKDVLDPIHTPKPATEPATGQAALSTMSVPPSASPSVVSEPPSTGAPSNPLQTSDSSPLGPAKTSDAGESLTPCVDAWIKAYRKEVGEESIVTEDQLDEWQQWCNQGKHPSTSQQ